MTRPPSSAGSWNRIKELFQAAIERDPRNRHTFLEEACGDDRALHQEVASLLAAHEGAGRYAERPAIEALAEATRASGHYHIVALIGAGGMGEVYRARDAELGRDVAIKTLPPTFAGDPQRLARFDREAHVLAALNHPNICAIYGMTDVDGMPGLVLELVEGPTLAERIAARRTTGRGLSMAEALGIAADIARALEAAHDRGIVHRDLKPANVKITPDGVVKVLDFGLAKAMADDRPSGPPADATRDDAGSRSDVPMGTAAYMAPEQARGESVDKRTDVWSFGAVLYEMLAGVRAIKGTTVSETIAAVLNDDVDWTALPAELPPAVHRLLRRCLEKDVKRRLKDIGDARFEIEDALNQPGAAPSGGEAVVPATARAYGMWPWAASVGIGLGVATLLLWWRPAPSAPHAGLRQVSAELGADATVGNFEYGTGTRVILSPDGATLAFVARPREGAPRQLYIRRLDALRATPLGGTEGALNPFFSPDGAWIAFVADNKLKKVPATGGGTVEICRVINNRGGTWGEHGVIAFSPDRYNAALWQVPDAGGEPKPLTALADGERTQRWPQFLQNGNAVLFTGNDRADGFGNANVVVQTLPDGPRKVLVRGAYFGRYLPSGHLVYVHSGTLFAAPFDPDRLELTGPAVPALEGALVNPPVGAAEIAISGEGTVAFLPASEQASTLAAPLDWMDRRGATTPLLRDTPVRWLFPRFAPDGRRLAFSLFDGKEQDVWVYDWSAEALSRVTFDPGGDLWPVWTPDGRRIVFLSNRDGAGDLYWQRVDGTGEVQRLTRSSRPQYPGSWHPDGRTLVFFEDDPATSTRNVMALRIGGDEASGWQPGRPTLVLSGADRPMLSPDGRWLAYVSRTATPEVTEVFVRSFPGPGGPWQVSTAGGTDPLWSSTRPEIFYATPDHRIMAASYSVSGGFRVEKPHLLSEARFTPRSVGRHFDIHPDGNRFALAGAPPAQTGSSREHVTLIFNFFDHLRRIAPPGARSGLPWRLP